MELLFLALFSLHILRTDAVDPHQWHLTDPACKGDRQSPINIVTRDVVYDRSLKPLTFEGYDGKGSSKWNVENNGHTVKVTLDASPKIGGGGLARKYKAVEFHLHWGVPSMQQSSPGVQQYIPGSEHSIDGEKYAMELHLVHIREDVPNVAEAKKYKDGLAVLAFFIKVDEENKNYATLLNELENIQYKGLSAQIDPLPLSSLLPPKEELGRYYRYEGSLTTPDCFEGVIWTIFERPIELSLLQLSYFAALHFDGKNSTHMIENFRPVQPLHERKVSWSSASTVLPPAKLLLLLLTLTFFLSSPSQ
ncbi:carbonic anhydrase 4 isoform X2 [Myiozetetes cayanensis]|uniref:carbonic anhydrase 4 isoform X2 n=1 Tax=Myiozetetes cayanensis TaxID=478635 RepID=UPI00215F840D|nr:carbonic anhydrase 4 isoform X2 [Myiozetetes cayanensis]